MRIILPLLFIVLLIGCYSKPSPNLIIIEGHVPSLHNGKIYLAEATHWQTPLDSAMVQNGHFLFKLRPDSSFIPYMACLNYVDSTAPVGIGDLSCVNEFLRPADTSRFNHYRFNAFYLEKGVTQLNEELAPKIRAKHSIPVFIKAGRETEIMYKNQFTDFGWLGNLDSVKRMQRIAFFKQEINRYPFSYFLLSGIYNAKEQYSKEEMSDFLSQFNKDVQVSPLGMSIRTYLSNRPSPGEPDPNLLLADETDHPHYIIDPAARLNMLVFWASWCGPCRREIPVLKQIYSKYTGKGLHLVSISMDMDRRKWQTALSQEKMPWAQYLADSAQNEKVRQHYNFAAIPLIVFTDGGGKEIKRFLGSEPGEEQQYQKVIETALNGPHK